MCPSTSTNHCKAGVSQHYAGKIMEQGALRVVPPSPRATRVVADSHPPPSMGPPGQVGWEHTERFNMSDTWAVAREFIVLHPCCTLGDRMLHSQPQYVVGRSTCLFRVSTIPPARTAFVRNIIALAARVEDASVGSVDDEQAERFLHLLRKQGGAQRSERMRL